MRRQLDEGPRGSGVQVMFVSEVASFELADSRRFGLLQTIGLLLARKPAGYLITTEIKLRNIVRP